MADSAWGVGVGVGVGAGLLAYALYEKVLSTDPNRTLPPSPSPSPSLSSSLLRLNRKEDILCLVDVETTVPATDMIEFGAIWLDKYTFHEIHRFECLVFCPK